MIVLRPAPALIDWRTIQDRFPWGVMILFGGGFALADGSKESWDSFFLFLKMNSHRTKQTVMYDGRKEFVIKWIDG